MSFKIKLAEIIYLKYYNKLKFLKGKKELDKYKKIKHKKKIVITLTPTHGNLGDHAIAYATIEFIKNRFPQYEILELDINEIYTEGKALRNSLGKDDIIMILGGGNMGDSYKHEEWTRRFIISNFKKTQIISLPQTIDFSNSTLGELEFRKTKKVYNNHKKIKILSREEESFNIMKNSFGKSKVGLYPDMVLYLKNKVKTDKECRHGIMLCLRNDKEGLLDRDFKKSLKQKLMNKHSEIICSDTVINKNVNKETRETELRKLWSEISSVEVVITDRLHGMIFSSITSTPCVVLKTYNHKLTSFIEWFKNISNIVLLDENNIEFIDEAIDKVIKGSNNTNFDKEFEKLAEFIELS